MIVIAPLNAPQVHMPPLNGVEHPLAPEVMNAMLRHGSRPVSLWRVINGLADTRHPQGRDQRRCLCLRFWGAVRELLRFGVLFRHGGQIATVNFATRPRPKLPRRLSLSVGGSTSENGGSNPVAPISDTGTDFREAFHREVVTAGKPAGGAAPDTKSAVPTPAEVTAAARALAQQPRRRKKLTGWLHGRRVTRLTPVIVPGGQVLPAHFVRRGFVYVLLPDTPEYQDRVYDRYRADDVRIYRSPHAALLGRLPPQPGRKRGRPRTSLALPCTEGAAKTVFEHFMTGSGSF